MSKNFVVFGMGFVADRHLAAIKAIGGNVVAFHDQGEVVGKIDSYFLDARYYKDFIHLDCFIDRLRRDGGELQYGTICLPNHLHNPVARYCLKNGMDAIVEKPIVLHEYNIDELQEIEKETGNKVYPVMQLRYHPNTEKAKSKYRKGHHRVKIAYHVVRGPWFLDGYVWKSREAESGGLIYNVGSHATELATYLFGKCCSVKVSANLQDFVSAKIELERASVDLELSVTNKMEPKRVFEVDGEQIDFSGGFNDLHTTVYQKIMAGEGMTLEDTRESIRICQQIREWNQHEHRRCA